MIHFTSQCMSDTITYDPFNDRRTAADTTVKILALLEDGTFRNQTQIQNSNILETTKQTTSSDKSSQCSRSLSEHEI